MHVERGMSALLLSQSATEVSDWTRIPGNYWQTVFPSFILTFDELGLHFYEVLNKYHFLCLFVPFYLFLFWVFLATPSGAQVLFLALDSEIAQGSLKDHRDAGNESRVSPGLAKCKANTLPLPL